MSVLLESQKKVISKEGNFYVCNHRTTGERQVLGFFETIEGKSSVVLADNYSDQQVYVKNIRVSSLKVEEYAIGHMKTDCEKLYQNTKTATQKNLTISQFLQEHYSQEQVSEIIEFLDDKLAIICMD